MCEFISGLSILFHSSIYLFFVPIPHCFDYCSFVVLSEVWRVMPPALFFFLRVALAILGLLWFHINFRIICSSSVKNVMGNLIRIAMNLWIALGSIVSNP